MAWCHEVRFSYGGHMKLKDLSKSVRISDVPRRKRQSRFAPLRDLQIKPGDALQFDAVELASFFGITIDSLDGARRFKASVAQALRQQFDVAETVIDNRVMIFISNRGELSSRA